MSFNKNTLFVARRDSRNLLRTIILSAAFSAGMALQPAFADEAQEVTRLLRAGQLDQALSRADAFLATKPRDAQMRFLKGLVLTEQGKTQDSIQVFIRLTEDYPELPEPYNNLAVLYASQGQFDKARASLEMAIRTHPSYATAHENLGDVYAKLASQAYDKAFSLDTGNTTAQTKLAMIRDLVGGGKNRPTSPTTLAANTAKPVSASPAATVNVLPTPTPISKPTTPVEPPKPQIVQQTPAPVTTAPTISPQPAKIAEPKADNEQDEIIKTVNNWALAWSKQDTRTYLGYYGKDFDTPKGQNRPAWEKERRERIEGKDRIEVRIEQPQVSISGNVATVKFRQNYKSDRLSTSSRKTLVLQKTGSKWSIIAERAGG